MKTDGRKTDFKTDISVCSAPWCDEQGGWPVGVSARVSRKRRGRPSARRRIDVVCVSRAPLRTVSAGFWAPKRYIGNIGLVCDRYQCFEKCQYRPTIIGLTDLMGRSLAGSHHNFCVPNACLMFFQCRVFLCLNLRIMCLFLVHSIQKKDVAGSICVFQWP